MGGGDEPVSEFAASPGPVSLMKCANANDEACPDAGDFGLQVRRDDHE
jgi:hypothetical protein